MQCGRVSRRDGRGWRSELSCAATSPPTLRGSLSGDQAAAALTSVGCLTAHHCQNAWLDSFTMVVSVLMDAACLSIPGLSDALADFKAAEGGNYTELKRQLVKSGVSSHS